MRFSKLFVFVAVCIAALTFTSSAYAKIETVTADGIYTMGKNDSQAFAEESAYQDALRKAADQVGVYVESYSESQGGILTKDQIKVVSASLLSVKSKEFEYDTIDKQAFKIICHIKAEADTSNDNLKALIEDKKKLNQNEALAKQVEELQRQLQKRDEETAAERAEREKQYLIKAYEKNLAHAGSIEIKKHYIEEIQKLDLTNELAQCEASILGGQYAVDNALSVLKIDPSNYIACSSLANIYYKTDKEKFNYYANKAILSIREKFTPEEIKKMCLLICVNMSMVYPPYNTEKNALIQDLYSRYFYDEAYHLHSFTTTNKDEIFDIQTIKKYAEEHIEEFKQKENLKFDIKCDYSALTDYLIKHKGGIDDRAETIIVYVYSEKN